jgi:hypothetical protein
VGPSGTLMVISNLTCLSYTQERLNARAISGRGRWVSPFILLNDNIIDGVENEKKDY